MKRLILILLAFLFVTPVFGQLTITHSDFLALVGVVKTRSTFHSDDQAAVVSLIAKAGAGQTWSLSGISFSATGSATEELVAGTSGALGASDPAFASATHHYKSSVSTDPDSTNYLFLTIAADAASALGSAWDSSGTVQKIYYTPANKIMQFPLALGTNWISNTSISTSSEAGSISVMNVYEVDGEGTLVLPQGQSKAVLRVRTMQIVDLGFIKDTTTIYSFMGKTDREAASIIAPKTVFGFPIPGSITYSVGGGSGGGVREISNDIFSLLPNSPNPFRNETTISYVLHKDAHVKILVHDQLGNEVATVVDEFNYQGQQAVTFSAKEIPSGQYYYTLTADGKSITMPMMVTK